ncbi:glycoside hydrolase family 78 protein [Flavobacterium glaciei]|uniref:SusE-like outer membrane protein n=1 Tax=Flavobacterium glaciei TaxID=386300 RepID=A0A562PQ36_9FLAO|nr:SusE domain-containing protein [Flavobacterium glaciei]RDI52428.1 SusE-like outer membrane protein [Flavobacterium glaciei]TWI46176.1 SusE-like outer membrane protein [Flavobacterium glaciei]
MKKNVYLAIISVLIISCDNGDAPPETANVAPTIPTLASPVNNKLCINNSVSFEWNASTDANNDAVVYQIQIAKDKDFANIVMSGGSSATYQNFTLEKATAYYWRVKSIDSKGLSSNYSSIFSFYTSGVGVINYLPFLPDLVAPELNALVNPTALQLRWTASDVDVKDKLVYDVYFGTTNPPVNKIGDDLTNSTLDVVITGAKEYFWKVVVKDDKGGTTIGQTWRFRTN